LIGGWIKSTLRVIREIVIQYDTDKSGESTETHTENYTEKPLK